MSFKTTIEPFRIKMVEPLRMSSEAERIKYLEKAWYNPFLLSSNEVLIDMLTDSGTSAMSNRQWAGMMMGDESYAGASSWERFEEAVHRVTGMPYILPTHQGRAAERILYSYLGGPDKIFISNTHFDTTRANIEYTGSKAIDLPCIEAADEDSDEPFKGNLDLDKLEAAIHQYGVSNIAGVILTVTNNSGGGQPVSMANARAVAEICRRENILFILDMCRLAENSYFVRHKEPGMEQYSYLEIGRAMCDLADACVMSAKKDALVNMGGFLSLRHGDMANACTAMLIITEGFTTYGGLSGRDMEAVAVGLEEGFDADYLHYRISSTAYLGNKIKALGIPVLYPIGGHAVYVDAHRLYPQIPVHEYPGQSLVCELYRIGGVRSVEIGSVMFGKYDETGRLVPASRELVRLAIPRRVYTQSHIDYVGEVFEKLLEQRDKAIGYRIIQEMKFLRHFTARFEPI